MPARSTVKVLKSLSQQVLASSAYLLIIRFIQRGIGLISTLILARLLTPADFGLVAIIAIVIQFFEIMSAVGSEPYIIQKTKVDDNDLDTAWSINIVIKLAMWLILLTCSPLIANFFDKPELNFALQVSSLALLFGSVLNPGIILFKKNLDYSRILKLSIYQKVISFAVVMATIYVHPSYWALVFGNLTSVLVFSCGSFLIHPFRPKWSLQNFRLQFNFSQWVLLRSIFGFIRSQIDTILITRTFSVSDVGVFHLVKSLIYMPAHDVIAPAVDPLFSAFSSIKDDPIDLAFKFRVGLCFIISLIVPLCFYIALFPAYIVNVLLGNQWTQAIDIFPYMTPLLFVLSVSRVYEAICVSLGKVKQLFYYNVISTTILTGCLLLLVGSTLEMFILFRSLIHLAITLVFPFYIMTFLNIDLLRIINLCIPVFTATLIAGYLSKFIEPWLYNSSLFQLIASCTIYFSIYTVFILLIYRLCLRNVSEYVSIKNAILEFADRNKYAKKLLNRFCTSKSHI